MDQSLFLGIDLGTSNTAASIAAKGSVSALQLRQLSQDGSPVQQELLPSSLFLCTDDESALYPSLCEPLATVELIPSAVAGIGARDKGALVPERCVQSAKSWLSVHSHSAEDSFLPFNSPDTERRVSPLQASAQYLQLVRASLLAAHPSAQYQTVITVPASFNERARQLTGRAAALAGFDDVVLLEEPLAAFYAWLYTNRDQWRDFIQPGDTVLVVDIGGGTTDFSLIAAEEEEGKLNLKRLRVGPHLLLGGDNMDLSLALTLKARLEGSGSALDSWQFLSLLQQSRKAKETLLSNGAPNSIEISITGRGASLFSSVRSCTISKEEIQSLIVDGFFPICDLQETPLEESTYMLEDFGLPFVHDPAVSRHLAQFLRESQQSGHPAPTRVLLNGGVCKSQKICERLEHQIANWFSTKTLFLANSQLDSAVSIGAAVFRSPEFQSLFTIKAALSKSYYTAVRASALAVPGVPVQMMGVCVAEEGMDEGKELPLSARPFFVRVGTPFTFELYESVGSSPDHTTTPHTVGSSEPDFSKLRKAGTLQTLLEPKDDMSAGERVQVVVSSSYSMDDGLQIFMRVPNSETFWKLNFVF
jgi:molecular chaperone DnaK (HSP70)